MSYQLCDDGKQQIGQTAFCSFIQVLTKHSAQKYGWVSFIDYATDSEGFHILVAASKY